MRVSDEKLKEILIALTDGVKTPEFVEYLYAVAPGLVKDLMDARAQGRVKRATKSALEVIEAEIPYEDIIGYLNAKTGRSYGITEPYRKMIRGRWSEGNRIEDFKAVIDNKCRDWLGDSRMEQYLRPLTLFAPTKFDSYKNQRGRPNARPEGRTGGNSPGDHGGGKYSRLSTTLEIPGLLDGNRDPGPPDDDIPFQ